MPKKASKTKRPSAAEESKPKEPKKPRTNRPKDSVKSKAGKASAAARSEKRAKGDPITRQCSARRTNGEPCRNSAIRGGTVCARHGGSAPQVRAKANQRLIEMVLPAMKELNRILNKADTADADKLRAIQMVLNRTGYNEKHTVDIGLREPNPWDVLTGGESPAFRIERGRESVLWDEEPEALRGGGGNEDTDDALTAMLDRRDRDREREASTRIDHRGHDVVRGDVIGDENQRPAADPFGVEEKERAEFARRVSEHDPQPVHPDGKPFARYEAKVRRLIEEQER